MTHRACFRAALSHAASTSPNRQKESKLPKNEFTLAGKKYRARPMSEDMRRDVMRWVSPAFEALLDAQGSKTSTILRALGYLEPTEFDALRETVLSHITRRCALGWRRIWNAGKFAFSDIGTDAEAQLFLRALTFETQEYYRITN
jgi:hypothetical protein